MGLLSRWRLCRPLWITGIKAEIRRFVWNRTATNGQTQHCLTRMGSPRTSCIEPQLSPSGHQSEGFFCALAVNTGLNRIRWRYLPLGMASDLKHRSIKISNPMWERWQRQASAAGVSVTALIVRSMDRAPADKSGSLQAAMKSVEEFSRQVDDLTRALDAERKKPKPSIDHGTVRTADLSSPKAGTAALPVTGDRFPKQLTWWQKKELAGSKGKAK